METPTPYQSGPRHEMHQEQEIHLRDYFNVLVKRKFIILTVLCIVFFTVVVKTYTTTPIYTAASQVLIERNYGSKGLDFQYYRYEPDFLDTQTMIIRSANVARKVVDNLELATRYRHYFLEEGDVSLLRSIRSTVSSALRNVVHFFTSFLESQPEVVEGAQGDGGGLASIPQEQLTDEDIIAMMIQGGLGVAPVQNTKIVTIAYSNKNPAIAKMIADGVVQAYMDEMLEIKLATSSYSVKWMTEKAKEERERLEKSERELHQFMRDNDLITVEDKLTLLPQKLTEFGRKMSEAEAETGELSDLLSKIKAAGNDLDKLEKIPDLATSDVLKSIRERTYKANQEIQELSKKFGPKHPKMIKATDELKSLNDEKRFEIERILSTITNSYELALSKEKSLQELLATAKSEVLSSNEKLMQYKILKREVDANRVMYDTLQTGIKQENVTDQSQSVNIWVTRKAEMPSAPSKPNKRRNLALGLMLGLFGGVGLAFFIEYLDNTVKGAKQLEDKFGITVLGSIEELRGKQQAIETYILKNPLSPLTESYRLVRSGLLLSTADKPPQTMLVTSMSEKEGKTSTAANVARVLAQGGSTVLVIDCDLRRPRMHEVFSVKNEVGLSSFLSGVTEESITRKIVSDGVDFIPSGPIPPAPAELLGSRKMKMLIEKACEKYDFVLIDSPPVQSVTDSLVLSKLVDGTIVVVRAGKTTNDILESGLKKLQDVNTNFLGFVLNGLLAKDAGKYYYGYSSYYTKES